MSFVDCVNRGDVDGLSLLIADDHTLQVLDEPPLVGRYANLDAWKEYLSAYPEYMIHVHDIAWSGDRVAVLGHTTGSHLALPDDEESLLTVIWIGVDADGLLGRWQVYEDTPDHRERFGLSSAR